MEIKVRVSEGVVILDLCGTIDVNSANLVEVVGQCVRDGYADILCNFEDISSIDYMGISAIVIAYKEIINNNGRMKFVNVPVYLKNLLSITGLDRAIEIYTAEDIAVRSFREDKIIESIKKMQLRRRFKRLSVDIKIELKSKYEESPVCFNVDIFNLSAVGAYIYGCGKFKLGDEVLLKFKAPAMLEGLDFEAKVVWLCDRQIQPHLYPGMGVEFYNISPSIQEKLLEYIERNLSRMPPAE